MTKLQCTDQNACIEAAEADIDDLANTALRDIIREIESATSRAMLATALGRLTRLLPIDHAAYCVVHRTVAATRQRMRDRHGAVVIRSLRAAYRWHAVIITAQDLPDEDDRESRSSVPP